MTTYYYAVIEKYKLIFFLGGSSYHDVLSDIENDLTYVERGLFLEEEDHYNLMDILKERAIATMSAENIMDIIGAASKYSDLQTYFLMKPILLGLLLLFDPSELKYINDSDFSDNREKYKNYKLIDRSTEKNE